MSVQLFTISDSFIRQLSQIDSRVLSNHENKRLHKRPYIGFLIQLGRFDYFLPLSSPDSTDYIEGKVRPSTRTILRRFDKDNDSIGKILLNNRIPVLLSQVTKIQIPKKQPVGIEDRNYINLLLKERKWISSHISLIIKNSKIIYQQKKNETNLEYFNNSKKPNYLSATVDFHKLEAYILSLSS